MRFFRRLFWYVSLYISRYRYIIVGSLVLFLGLTLVVKLIWPFVPHPKPQTYIGVVGSYNFSNLPSIVDKILSSGLTTSDSNQHIEPNLVSGWDISDGGKSYTFHLKPDLRWPDGSIVNASDIRLNIPGVNILTPDTNTITFQIPDVFAPFPSILTHPVFNSKGQTPTGYTVVVTQNNTGNLRKIRLESASHIIVINIFNTTSTALTAFKLGSVDYLTDLTTKPALEESSLVNIRSDTDYEHIVTLFFNTHDPLLTDKSIRQAIAYLISDKNFGFQKALTPINPSSWAFNPLVKTYDYSSERGHKFINDNLPAEKRNISLELSTLPDFLDIAQGLKNQLKSEGIELVIQVVTSTPTNYQLYLGNLTVPLDPDQYQSWHSTQNTNITKINDKKLDKFLEDGRTILDQKQRRQLYLDFQKTILEELPALFLYYPKIYHVSRGPLSF